MKYKFYVYTSFFVFLLLIILIEPLILTVAFDLVFIYFPSKYLIKLIASEPLKILTRCILMIAANTFAISKFNSAIRRAYTYSSSTYMESMRIKVTNKKFFEDYFNMVSNICNFLSKIIEYDNMSSLIGVLINSPITIALAIV